MANEADLKNIEGLNEGVEVQEGVVWLSDSDKATHKLLQLKTVLVINLQEEKVSKIVIIYI